MNKFKWSIFVIIIQIILALYLGWNLPDDAKIPSHWNIKGEIDNYVGKWTGILLFPAINIGILLLFIVLPYISVRYKKAKERFNLILPLISLIIIFFFACIHIYTILLAKKVICPAANPIFFLMGMMFIFLGNVLPKIPSNFFAGIRTPWTLSSENVWRKTHRSGGYSFVLGGLLMIMVPLLWRNSQTALIVMSILFLGAILYPVLYSFVLYKKEGK